MPRLASFLVLCLAAALGAAPAGPLEEGLARIERYEYAEARRILEPALTDPALAGEALVLITRSYNGPEDYKLGIEYGKRAVEALPASSANGSPDTDVMAS